MSAGTRERSSRLPQGVVTLLMADLEASTPLWERAPGAMRAALDEVGKLLDDASARFGAARPRDQGEGDSFLLAFARASDGLACAWSLRAAFAQQTWPGELALRFRMALHTGELELRDDGNYAGPALARCARVRDLGHGGQLLLTSAVHGLVLDALPAGAVLREHGSHGLRGLTRPETVHELSGELDGEKALRERADPRRDLPAERASLIGRAAECAALETALGESALVTLVGAGGSGKTRLALRAAHRGAERYPDGACWVDVAELRDPDLVLRAVASATGLTDAAKSGVAGLARALARKRMLVVLDNCEHLIEACAEVAEAIVALGARVRLLATSREPLRVAGESVLPVPPLALPDESADAAAIAEVDAVRLLVERGARLRPDLRVTPENAPLLAAICRRLDGLPLAIELAAARLRVLSPKQVLAGLADRFRLLTGGSRAALARQRTLEASVEWSWELLDDDERRVLRRLAIFAGSFDLAAAEAVCGDAQLAAYGVLDVLSRLVDRSLVQAELEGTTARYRLLETVRAFAATRLAEEPDTPALRDLHLEHYAGLLEQLGPALASVESREPHERLDSDLANVRAALDWAGEHGRADRALTMLAASYLFWVTAGLEPEVYARLERLLEAPELDDATRARGNASAADFAIMLFEPPAALRFAARAIELARAANDGAALCEALVLWAYAAVFEEAPEPSDALCGAVAEAEDLARKLGPLHRWRVDMMGGFVLSQVHSLSDGLERLERACRVAGEMGASQLVSVSESVTASACASDGDLHAVRAHAMRAREASGERLAGTWAVMFDLILGMCESHTGALDAAEAQIARACETLDAAGRSDVTAWRSFPLAEIAFRRGELERARVTLDELEGARLIGSAGGGMVRVRALRILLDLHAGDAVAARARLSEPGPARAPLQAETDVLRAYAARALGEPDAAWEHAHDALERGSGWRLPALRCLEALAGLAVGRNRAELGARLLGAAERGVRELGYARNPVEESERAWGVEALRQALDPAAFERARAEGEALELAEAIELAKRGRGRRRRPSIGFESLTPTELEVAHLVCEGLSNPAVAKKLLVSVNTVKRHLSRTYGKLGISSRAELAALVTRREAARP